MKTETGGIEVQQMKYPLVLYSSPGRLQDLACVTIALHLLSCESKNSVDGDGFPDDFLLERITELIYSNNTQLPTVFRRMIDTCVWIVYDDLRRWRRRNYAIYLKLLPSGMIDLISWDTSGDGTIDYLKTAQNLVVSEILTAEERYIVACTHCLVEDIARLASNRLENFHPLVEYWNCRMEGKVYTVKNVNVERSCVEANLLWYTESIYITSSTFEYLWDFLTEDEQKEIVADAGDGVYDNYLIYALCNLKDSQLASVIEPNAVNIFVALSRQSESVAIRFWDYIKNLISVDSFYKIISEFLINDEYHMAFEVWISATDLYKKEVLTRYKHNLLENVYNSRFELITGFPRDARLMIDLLSANTSKQNEMIWREKWKSIIVGLSPERLQMVMKQCLGSDDEIISFKKDYMCKYYEIEFYLKKMLEFQCHKEFQEFLIFIADNSETASSLRIQALNSEYFFKNYIEDWMFMAQFSVMLKDNFINETFPDVDRLKEFKKYFILGEKSLKYFRSTIEEGLNFDIGRLCDHVLSPFSDILNEAKCSLLELFLDVLISAQFKCFSCTALEKFVKWCTNSDNYLSIKRLKQGLPLDTIFDKWIEESILEFKILELYQLSGDEDESVASKRSYNNSLAGLQFFLFWYFNDSNKVQDFKLSKLNAGKLTIEEIKLLLESEDRKSIKILLEWFLFEDNSKSFTDNIEVSMFEIILGYF